MHFRNFRIMVLFLLSSFLISPTIEAATKCPSMQQFQYYQSEVLARRFTLGYTDPCEALLEEKRVLAFNERIACILAGCMPIEGPEVSSCENGPGSTPEHYVHLIYTFIIEPRACVPLDEIFDFFQEYYLGAGRSPIG